MGRFSIKLNHAIIAEIGSVHDGSLGNACKLIEAAAACGADIIKFQTHIASAETLESAPMPSYFRGEPRFDYFQRTAFTEGQWLKLKEVCDEFRVGFLSSPFSIEAIDLLEKINVGAYKVPSGEVTNTPLLERLAQTGRPVILSSGMSLWKEIDQAVGILRQNNAPLVVMQCSSMYPCPPQKVGLNVVTELLKKYDLPVGFSDHTLGSAASFAAAALGATVIEKHFTFSRLMYGSDAANSMEPDEFKLFSSGLREIWTMLNHPVNKDDLSDYLEMKLIFEKSIVAGDNLSKGHVLTFKDMAFKKPGDGISASKWQGLIGRRLLRDIKKDQKLEWPDVQ
jgi:N,N'-diacetyllegionaminate synthase